MKRTKLLALLAVLAIVVAACGTGETTDTTGDATATTEGGDLLLLQWQAPSQANPYLSTGTKDLLAGSLVVEPLGEYDPTGAVVPALAAELPTQENGGIAEDQMSVTWTLQEGILWSDGTPLTAEDAVFTFEYCTTEETGCSSDAFVGVESVEAVDDLTIKVNFAEPTPYPFVPFVGYISPIIQKAQFEECIGAAAKTCSEQNFAPVGTGPYMVTELRPEDTVVYEMNPNYRGVEEGMPFFGNVTIKGGGDAEAAARSVLEIGEADYAWNLQVAPEILFPMEEAGLGEILINFTSSVEAIRLNQTDPEADPPSEYQGEPQNPTGGTNPFFYQKPDLVRAMSMAIDRDEVVAVGYGEAGQPTCTFWPVEPQQTTAYDFCLTQDIEGANALLDEAGYLDTDDDGVRETPDGLPLSFEYVTSINAVRQSTQELVKVYWQQIGIETQMRSVDAGLFFDGTCASDDCIWKFFTDIQMYTNSSSGPGAQSYFNSWTCSQIPNSANSYGGGNIIRYCSEEYDALYDQLASTPLSEQDTRTDSVIQMQDLVLASGLIPLVDRATVSAFSNEIQGVGDLNGWDSEYWNIEEWTRSG